MVAVQYTFWGVVCLAISIVLHIFIVARNDPGAVYRLRELNKQLDAFADPGVVGTWRLVRRGFYFVIEMAAWPFTVGYLTYLLFSGKTIVDVVEERAVKRLKELNK